MWSHTPPFLQKALDHFNSSLSSSLWSSPSLWLPHGLPFLLHLGNPQVCRMDHWHGPQLFSPLTAWVAWEWKEETDPKVERYNKDIIVVLAPDESKLALNSWALPIVLGQVGAEIHPTSENQMICQGSRSALCYGWVRATWKELFSLFNQKTLGLKSGGWLFLSKKPPLGLGGLGGESLVFFFLNFVFFLRHDSYLLFNHWILSDCFWSHGLQYARLLCPP